MFGRKNWRSFLAFITHNDFHSLDQIQILKIYFASATTTIAAHTNSAKRPCALVFSPSTTVGKERANSRTSSASFCSSGKPSAPFASAALKSLICKQRREVEEVKPRKQRSEKKENYKKNCRFAESKTIGCII